MAARMSSSVSCGYSVRTSWWLMPLAKKSSNSETQMREPRMQGLPKHTLGSTEIRCSSGFITFSRSCADGARHVPRMRRNEPTVKRRPVGPRLDPVEPEKDDARAERGAFVAVNERMVPAQIKQVSRRHLREVGVRLLAAKARLR